MIRKYLNTLLIINWCNLLIICNESKINWKYYLKYYNISLLLFLCLSRNKSSSLKTKNVWKDTIKAKALKYIQTHKYNLRFFEQRMLWYDLSINRSVISLFSRHTHGRCQDWIEWNMNIFIKTLLNFIFFFRSSKILFLS